MPDLTRFVTAQQGTYDTALAELRAGRKQTHWMWFIFPQIAGLGRSETARFYAIADRAEAKAYLTHRVLGARLVEATQAILSWAGRRSAESILGPVDALKFHSSMTLFDAVAAPGAPFASAIGRFYAGVRDPATVARI